MADENLNDLELELLKMNIKRTQGLQPADAGKYHHLKKKIAALKNKLRQDELKAAVRQTKPPAQRANETVKPAEEAKVKETKKPKAAKNNKQKEVGQST